VTGVGEACFPVRSFSAFARDEAAAGDHALFPSSAAENIDVRGYSIIRAYAIAPFTILQL